jgi:hypothetical protein
MQMTHEDEEFNRIEMESRIRQEQGKPNEHGGRPMTLRECMEAEDHQHQHEWVELTEQELVELRARVQEYTPIDSVKYGEAIQRAMNNALKEKNA